jgi:hypothetical protein
MTAAAALLLALASSAQKSAAQVEAPSCDAANAGRAEAQAGVRCVCVHTRGGGIAPTPSGWRWDCSILRSRSNADVEASPGGYDGALPSSVYIDQGRHDVPKDRDRDPKDRDRDRNDRKKAGNRRGSEHEGPLFHEEAKDRHEGARDRFSHGDRHDNPYRMSPGGDR